MKGPSNPETGSGLCLPLQCSLLPVTTPHPPGPCHKGLFFPPYTVLFAVLGSGSWLFSASDSSFSVILPSITTHNTHSLLKLA